MDIGEVMNTSDGLGGDSPPVYRVVLTGWGFQLERADVGELRPEVWAAKYKAERAGGDLAAYGAISRANRPDRVLGMA